MTEPYRLSIVICAVDETFSLERTFSKLDAYGEANEFLFVLAKNCSDGCLATVERLCARPDCRWMYQPGVGFGDAIQAAIREVKGTHMVVWSADEATDIASFPEMLRLSKENPEAVVKISRFLHPEGFADYGQLKKLLNKISQRCFGLLYHSDLTEFTNPTQIAPVALYRSIRWERSGFEFTTEMVFKPLRLGIPFFEVPTKNVKREEGRSHRSTLAVLCYYYMILKIRLIDLKKLTTETSQ